MRRFLTSSAVVVAALIGCAAPLKSEPIMPGPDGVPLAASQAGFTLRLEDPYGNSLPAHYSRGGTYIEGQMGQAYAVRVDNPTSRRIEVVVTVDGRDVITGEPGDFTRQRGYIVQPYGQVRITGFRQSLNDVATFRFTTPGDSYSARRGTPQHVGVIGAAIFSESAPPPPPPAYQMPYGGDEDRAGAAKTAEAAPAPAQSNLGTQYGESRYAPVTEVSFQRANASQPDAVLAVYYDDRPGLIRRGVLPPEPYPYQPLSPQPFPESRRFAPPPG